MVTFMVSLYDSQKGCQRSFETASATTRPSLLPPAGQRLIADQITCQPRGAGYVDSVAEPITFSLAAIAVAHFAGEHSLGHIIGGEALHSYREFLEHSCESPIDPQAGLLR